MKAFLIACAALIVIAVAAGFVLNARFAEPASERYVVGDAVRLDDAQSSDPATRAEAEAVGGSEVE